MLFWLKKCKRLVFRMVQQFCRRVAEGSPKSRRERILADINARPPDKRELGNFRDRIAIHNGRDGAGQEKKRKSPPQEKSPQQKKRNRCLRLRLLTGGCAALLSRFFSLFLRRLRRLLFLPSPRFSLLLWAARRPSSLLLLSRFFRAAAPPYPFRFSSASLPLLRRLRRLTLPLSLVGGWRRPLAPLSYTMKSRLSETHMGIGVPLSPDCENQRFSCQGLLRLSLSEACFVTVTCHKLFFFYFLP